MNLLWSSDPICFVDAPLKNRFPLPLHLKLEIVFTRAAPTFDNLFMGCVLNVNTAKRWRSSKVTKCDLVVGRPLNAAGCC